MGLRCVTPNTGHIIDDTVASSHCRVDTDEELTLVQVYRDAAEKSVLDHIHRPALLPSEWLQTWNDFPADSYGCRAGPIVPAVYPITEVLSVTYFDSNGVEQTLDPATYSTDLDCKPGMIYPFPDRWPVVQCRRPNAVRVSYKAGYASPQEVPAPIRAAILLRLGTLFSNREDVVTGTIAAPLSDVIVNLLSPYVNRWTT